MMKSIKNLSKKAKIIWISALCGVLALCSVVLIVWSVFWRLPKVEELYDRVVELVEGSHDLNTVIYGAGLPVYATDSSYAEMMYMYYNFPHLGYEIVTEYAKFQSEEQIKAAAEQIYSKAYLEEVIYPALFVGYAIPDSMGGADYAYARYLCEDGWIYQVKGEDNDHLSGVRIYDFSTMRILPPGNANACYVTVDSWLEDSPDRIESIRLRLVRADDGIWYLDSFAG